MATRKTATQIDPVSVVAIALKAAKTKSDYSRVITANKPTDVEAAWATLSSEDQQRITGICNNSSPPDLQAIANELAACGTLVELQSVKAECGESVARAAWKLIPTDERLRLKSLCNNGQQRVEETPQPVTEEPAPYRVEQQSPKRSLYEIGRDMHSASDELEVKLDATDDPDEQARLIDLWLQQNTGIKDEMLERMNAYLWVLRKQKQLAEYRATEGKRLRELAEQSENLAKRLEGQLLNFMDAHNLGKLETKDFKVSSRHAS